MRKKAEAAFCRSESGMKNNSSEVNKTVTMEVEYGKNWKARAIHIPATRAVAEGRSG